MKKLLFSLIIGINCLISIIAQEKTISGTIINGEDNLPLIGATVYIKGTTIGTITDFEGKFVLKIPADAQTLVISFVGFETIEMPIGDKTEFNLTLNPITVKVDEVVVTAIAIKREKKALGYGVQDVKSDEIEKSHNDNIVNSLAGKVAGVNIVSSSGAAGASTFIEIRGGSSIIRSNRPLFVIDGVPVDGGGGEYSTSGFATSDRIGDLNPDDIESISVLKGGAATALYGIRAANGVVVITTKSGKDSKDKKININIHSSVSFDKISQVPQLQQTYVQGSYYEADVNMPFYYGRPYSRINSPDGPEYWRAFSWGPHKDSLTYTTDPAYMPFDNSLFGYLEGGDYLTMSEYMKKYDPNGRIVYKPEFASNSNVPANYFGYNSDLSGGNIKYYNPYDFFKTGITLMNSINMTGGDEKTNYYFSFANTKIDGIIPNNIYIKNNVKFSARTELYPKLTTEASINYMNNSGNRIQQGNSTSALMLGLLRTPFHFNNAYGYEFDDETQRNYQGNREGSYDNPYWIVNNIYYRDNLDRIIGYTQFNYNPFEWINITYRFGTDWYLQQVNNYYKKYSNANRSGEINKATIFNRDLNSDLVINLNKKINENIATTLLLGNNLYQYKWKVLRGNAYNLNIAEWNNLANSSDLNTGESSQMKRTMAFFGDFGLSYRNFLYFNFTGRYEGSTTFKQGKNFFFYPSLSLGFIFSELETFKKVKFLSFGKLRTSYAITAYDADPYSLTTNYTRSGIGDGSTSGISFPFMGYSGFSLNNVIANEDLKPEKQKAFEIGADIRMFNSSLRLDIAYFNNHNVDLLIQAPVAASSGYKYYFRNIGTRLSQGIELLAGFTAIKTSAFNWEILVNYTKTNTKVTYLSDNLEYVDIINGFDDPRYMAVVNQPYRTIWGTRFKRDENGNLLISADPKIGPVGYPILDTETGIIGQVEPDYKIGLTNTFNFKNISLSFLLDIKKGGQMWNGTKGALYYFGVHKDTETRDTETKIFEGLKTYLDKDRNYIVSTEKNDVAIKLDEKWYHSSKGLGSAFNGPQEQFIENTDWFRLRELNLIYKFNQKIFKKGYIKGLEVYFTGKNLILITPYTGVDPETSLFGNGNGQGADYFNMPGTKSYAFGIKLSI
jgi:TonB-linked SusC/RagA family outer membrane protein